MVGASGFGPLKSLTTDLQSAPFGRSGTLPYMELVNGVEPSTCWLQISCSAIEPHQQIIAARLPRNSSYYTILKSGCQYLIFIFFNFRNLVFLKANVIYPLLRNRWINCQRIFPADLMSGFCSCASAQLLKTLKYEPYSCVFALPCKKASRKPA